MMQKYLRWSCGFKYGIVMLTLKWFSTFELMTQPSKYCAGAENR